MGRREGTEGEEVNPSDHVKGLADLRQGWLVISDSKGLLRTHFVWGMDSGHQVFPW